MKIPQICEALPCKYGGRTEGKQKSQQGRNGKHKSSSFLSGYSKRASISSSLRRDSLLLKIRVLEIDQNICKYAFTYTYKKAETEETEISVIQMVEKQYIRAVDYRTYGLAKRSPKNDYTVSGYVSKLIKKMKTKMKALFFTEKTISRSPNAWQRPNLHAL